MDHIGPLLKSTQGHEYILLIMDFSTKYPEVQKATSCNIRKGLVLLYNHMAIPNDILIDQGMPFVPKLMIDLCRLLQDKHLKTSVYHPQTDGLVERFNQTLKRML